MSLPPRAIVRSVRLLVAAAATLALAAGTLSYAATPAQDFAAADADRDGRLDPAEFRRFIALGAAAGRDQPARILARKAYDQAFGRLDKDGDRYLTPGELRAK